MPETPQLPDPYIDELLSAIRLEYVNTDYLVQARASWARESPWTPVPWWERLGRRLWGAAFELKGIVLKWLK